MKDKEIGWAWSSHGGRKEMHTKFLWVNLKERDHM